jgi:glucose-6-phosphate 1-dehydrogenase
LNETGKGLAIFGDGGGTLGKRNPEIIPGRPGQANFSYQASFGSKGPVAYETLLLDSMRGEQRYLRVETK